MSEIRSVMKAFVLGELDFAGLERKLAEALATGGTRHEALEALEQIGGSERLSPAVAGLIRRAVDRHLATDDTDPFPEIRPSEERRASSAADEGEADGDELPPIYAEGAPEEESAPPSSAAEPVVAPEPGAVIAGRYELEQIIGQGGSSLVYRALDRCRAEADAEEPRVALKIVKPGLENPEEARRRLLAEGMRGAELKHENVVRVIDLGMDGSLFFVTMELLAGDSLRNAIVRRSPDGFPLDEGLKIFGGIARGLSFLHQRGLVHGDLKPGNVFTTSDGVPKLLDFGTAVPGTHGREPTLDAGPPPARTPAYASPEVLSGSAPGFTDDVFALGCVACELLSSRHPFGRVQADRAREERLRPALPAGVGSRRRRALAAALSFDGRRRPRDASALLEAMGVSAREERRGGLTLGALGGLAVGILMVLAIIDPEGPLGRLVERAKVTSPVAVPEEVAAGTTDGEGAAREPTVPTRIDVAGRYIPVSTPGDTPVPAEDPASADEAAPEPDAADGPAVTPEPEEERESAAAAVTETLSDSPGPAPTSTSAPAPPSPGRLSFSSGEYGVAEGDAVVTATIRREGGLDGEVTVRWRTVADSAADDEDFIGSDWQEAAIGDGEDRTRLYVPLVDDGLTEGEESFFIEISDPGGGATLGSPSRVRVRINDDELIR